MFPIRVQCLLVTQWRPRDLLSKLSDEFLLLGRLRHAADLLVKLSEGQLSVCVTAGGPVCTRHSPTSPLRGGGVSTPTTQSQAIRKLRGI